MNRTRLATLAVLGLPLALSSACVPGSYEPTGDAAPSTAVTPTPAPSRGPIAGAVPVPAGPVTTADTSLGRVLVDARGLTLYGFTKDADGTPTCQGACATAWSAVLVDGAALPAGLDPGVFSVVRRPDGGHQLEAGKWPLYTYTGDAGPGDVNGQGSGGVWFVLDPRGGLVRGAGVTPSGAGTPASGSTARTAPPTTAARSKASGAGSYGYGY